MGDGELGDLPLRYVRARHIRALVTHLANQLASRSMHNTYSMLHAMFDDAYADELVENNPCRLRRGDLPVAEDDPRIPIDRRMFYATAFLGACGSGELSALRVRDYDCTTRPLPRLTVCQSFSVKLKKPKSTKTRVTRLVPVHPVLERALDDWLAHGFGKIFGRPQQPNDLMFPAPGRGGRSHGCWALLANEPTLTKTELARRLGVLRQSPTRISARASAAAAGRRARARPTLPGRIGTVVATDAPRTPVVRRWRAPGRRTWPSAS
jgi:hypothetical protein